MALTIGCAAFVLGEKKKKKFTKSQDRETHGKNQTSESGHTPINGIKMGGIITILQLIIL